MFASVPCVSGTAVLTLELAMKIVSIITPCFHMLLIFYFENPLLSQKFSILYLCQKVKFFPLFFLKLGGRIFQMFLSHGRVEKMCFPSRAKKSPHFHSRRNMGGNETEG